VDDVFAIGRDPRVGDRLDGQQVVDGHRPPGGQDHAAGQGEADQEDQRDEATGHHHNSLRETGPGAPGRFVGSWVPATTSRFTMGSFRAASRSVASWT